MKNTTAVLSGKFFFFLFVLLFTGYNVFCSPRAETPSSAPAKEGALAARETTLRVLMPEHASYPVKEYQDSPFLQYITGLTNIKLDLMVVPDAGNAYREKLNIMLNGNDIPDIIWSSMDDRLINSLAVRGMFAAYTDYLNIAPNLRTVINTYADVSKNFSADNGKLYIMPRLTLNTMTEIFLLREDLLEAEKLSQPQNYEDLYTILKTLHTKYPQMAAFINRNGTEHIINRLAYSWGSGYETATSGFYLDRKADKYVFGPADANFYQMVLWLKKLYDEGILDKDYALMTTAQWEEAFANERAIFAIDFIARVETINNSYINKGSKARVAALNPPAGPTGQRGIMGRLSSMPNSGIVVNARSSNVEAAIKLVDWIYSDKGRYISLYGIEGETFTIGEGGRPSLTAQMKRQANPNGKELVRDFGWVYYLGKYEFPVGYENPVPGDPVPADNRLMYSRNVMESINAVIPPDPTLSYTDDQAKVLRNNGTEIRDHFTQNIDKFIMGTRPLSEWNAFVAEFNALGINDLSAALNAAYAVYKAK
jgi:ABC-type glycerol-3-phosphate transport system substrate-binding protein